MPRAQVAAPNEVGEIVVHKTGGWFKTKDRGWTDEEGYFYHGGRADDVVISAGWTMGVKEIEDTLLKHEAVVEVAVIRGNAGRTAWPGRQGLCRVATRGRRQAGRRTARFHTQSFEPARISATDRVCRGKLRKDAIRQNQSASYAQAEVAAPDRGPTAG